MSEKEGRILVVDDDQDVLTAARLLLKRSFAVIATANRPDAIPDMLSQNSFDAVLLDMNFSLGDNRGEEGLRWIDEILSLDPHLVVIVITAHGGIELAVEAMKRGATDFIMKPWQNEKLVSTLKTAVSLSRSRSEADAYRGRAKELEKSIHADEVMIGESPAMQQLRDMIHRAAPTDANIMILGENGSGKELVAREIHRHSLRSGNVFLSVDLGAISDNLFESELFGHKKGAFTDAREDRIGRMQAANGGTLFLDEIGNLSLALQTKLLTVLERRQVTPVGSNRPVDIDVRLISATNMPPSELAQESKFRPDLRYRLNTVEINVPPLRNRTEDIPLLVDHFVRIYSQKYGKGKRRLDRATLDALCAYDWPGNVRELRHAIERAVILAPEEEFRPGDFALSATAPAPGQSVQEELPTNLNLEEVEKATLERALRLHKGNISHAAKELGITRASLYRRMEKHGL